MVAISALGWPSLSKPLRRGVVGLAPVGEVLRACCVEGGELGVVEDGGLDLGERQLQARVAGAAGGLEQRGAHAGQTSQ